MTRPWHPDTHVRAIAAGQGSNIGGPMTRTDIGDAANNSMRTTSRPYKGCTAGDIRHHLAVAGWLMLSGSRHEPRHITGESSRVQGNASHAWK